MTQILKNIPISIGESGEIVFESGASLGESVTADPLVGNTDNLSITGIETAVLIRISSEGNYDLTGLVPFTKTSSWMHFVVNVGNNNITLKDNSASSLPDHRFLINANKTIQSNEGILLFYDTISFRWRAAGILI